MSPLRVHRIEDLFNTEGHWRHVFVPNCWLRLPRFSSSDTFRLVKLLPCTLKPVYSHVILSNWKNDYHGCTFSDENKLYFRIHIVGKTSASSTEFVYRLETFIICPRIVKLLRPSGHSRTMTLLVFFKNMSYLVLVCVCKKISCHLETTPLWKRSADTTNKHFNLLIDNFVPKLCRSVFPCHWFVKSCALNSPFNSVQDVVVSLSVIS